MDASELAGRLTATIREGAGAEAVALLSLEPHSEVAASAMSAAVNALYRQHRDVGNMIVAAHLGASWCLGQAALQGQSEAVTALKRRARAMCFNAAANCWPGWGDEDVTIDDGDVAAAMGLAGLCQALAEELGLGPEAQGTSHWLIGALELARGDIAAARRAFAEAERNYAVLGDDAPQTLMVRSYDALAAKRATAGSDEAARALEAALDLLDGVGTDQARFFAEQVRKAEQVFEAHSRVSR